MASLRIITTSFVQTLPRSVAGFSPWHLSHRKRRGCHLYGSFIKQFSSREMIHGSSEWRMIRPATAVERTFDTFHRNYLRYAIPGFVLNSRDAISEEIWRKALRHTTNKMEVLKLCLQEREENLWLCEVNNHDIDFKIIENKTVFEALEDLKNEGLDHSFWSLRLIHADHGEEHPIPELKQAFPHQYNLIFKFHHGLMDGITVMYFIRVYTEILNDILYGKTVNDDITFGKFIVDDPLQTRVKETQQALESDPLRLDKERERMLRVTMKEPILYSAYPKPKTIQPTTHHIVRKVDNAKVNALYKSCKWKNVTMTAGFEAVFNTALVEMVSDAGAVNDEYKINITQTISMRRYMDVEKDFNKFPLGRFLVGMQQDTYCKKVVRNHFWEHAHEIHNEFHSLLKNNGPIIESIVRPQVLGPIDPVILAKGPPQDNSDYQFSNTLDLTNMCFYEGSHVQLTKITNYNFMNNFLYPILFLYSTYRGFGDLTCSYDTGKVTDDTAHELMDRVMNVLDFVTK